jgi:hypothetical protein
VKAKNPKKRLDGKKICLALTSQMQGDLYSYRREKGIESEQELVRQAIASLIYNEYDDNSLKLSGLKDLRESLSQIKDMISVLFKYLDLMHLNLLAYHPEIAGGFKDAAFSSAGARHEKFFSSFRERIRDDPQLFEKILHSYVSGSLDE